ncbi:unnamed protein product [Lactuca saligna]|uniref:Uncharacterized protein n=1 Tax=Lactuca saligna TaxID=75948 RepID=A0AA35YU82_LACSI|nr:unnamed protein product [Lactuca saligna]
MRTGGHDGFEDYYFEEADAQADFRSPQTPYMPRPPNTPPTPHGSTSRGLDLGKSTARVLVSIGRIWIIYGPDSTIFPMRLLYRCFRISRPCKHWSTDKLRNNSKIAQQNRKTVDASGSTARHTASSIGFDKHRNDLEKMMVKPPTQYDVFMKKHGTTESKKNLQEIMKISNIAHKRPKKHRRCIYRGWSKNMEKIFQTIKMMYGYGRKPKLGKGKKNGDIYGIGTSYIHFVVSGTPSSQSNNPPNRTVHNKRYVVMV